MLRHRLSRALLLPVVILLVVGPGLAASAQPASSSHSPSLVVWLTDLWAQALDLVPRSSARAESTVPPAVATPSQPVDTLDPSSAQTSTPQGDAFPQIDPDG